MITGYAYRRVMVLGVALLTATMTQASLSHARSEEPPRTGQAPQAGQTSQAGQTPRAVETHRAEGTPRVVEITARRYEFTPKEITLKQGEPVILRLTTEDVTHGFLMKKLGIDAVIEPGTPTEITLTPQTSGTFTTICDHFCGEGHANMHMKITVE